MENRMDRTFASLRPRGEGALIPLVPGDRPPFTSSLELLDMFVQAGCDMVEIAIPARYPWMEGRTMQIHQLEAITRGIQPEDSFGLMKCARERYSDLPLVVINFMGPIFMVGQERYVEGCASAGMDCADIPDYPYIGSDDHYGLVDALHRNNIHFNVDITTDQAVVPEGSHEYEFLKDSIRLSSGFLFMIAQPGGASDAKPTLPVDKLKPAVERVRALEDQLGVDTPIIVVCGISTPEQVWGSVRTVGADGVMLGSAVSLRVQAGEPLERIQPFVAALKDATWS
jgi:tryptophan synthase alpha chain